jgi:membrane protease YdiL (CAAX protease family)
MNDPYALGPDPWDDPRPAQRRWDDLPESSAAEEANGAQTPRTPEYIECWRCGKLGQQDREVCVYCRAPYFLDRPPRHLEGRKPRPQPLPPVVKVVFAFIGLLVSLLIFFAIQMANAPAVFGREAVLQGLIYALVFQLIDAALVVHAWIWIGSPKPLATPSTTVRAAAWATAPPVLLLALGLNHLYFEVLRNFINFPFVEQQDFKAFKDLIPLAILVICVQPAILEEFFFRYLALNSLRTSMGTNGAVLVSSVMFGMAHIGNPLGLPYLFVLGIVLGYMRVWTGGLLLPMLVHFLHNLAVILVM